MKFFLKIIMVIMLMLLGSSAFAGQKKVLVVHSYHLDLPWVRQCNRGISGVFADAYVLDYVYLDTKRVSEAEYAGRVDAAMKAFRQFKPDLVMLGDDNALSLLGPRIAETGTPIVFFGINNNPRKYFGTIPANVTGVLERVPLFPWVRHLKRIVPGAKNALVLMDSSATSKAIIDVTFGDSKSVVIDGITVEYRIAATWAGWQRIILEPPFYNFITMPVFHALKDDSGAHVPTEDVVRWTSAHSAVPVFAYQDYAVNDTGVVGAYVIFGETHGGLAARLAKDILEGKSHRGAPSMDEQGKFYFNRVQLQRFGLTLPKEIGERAVYQ